MDTTSPEGAQFQDRTPTHHQCMVHPMYLITLTHLVSLGNYPNYSTPAFSINLPHLHSNNRQAISRSNSLYSGASSPPSPPSSIRQRSQSASSSRVHLTQQQINHKRRRASADQLSVLEEQFLINPTPNSKTRVTIGQRIKMTERSVQIWFQNKRAKHRTMAKKEGVASKPANDGSQGVVDTGGVLNEAIEEKFEDDAEQDDQAQALGNCVYRFVENEKSASSQSSRQPLTPAASPIHSPGNFNPFSRNIKR